MRRMSHGLDTTLSLRIEKKWDLFSRRENILSELLDTEERYVADLHSVLLGYRWKLISFQMNILNNFMENVLLSLMYS
jgi:phosphoribosyl-dephospho-CoA transferase